VKHQPHRSDVLDAVGERPVQVVRADDRHEPAGPRHVAHRPDRLPREVRVLRVDEDEVEAGGRDPAHPPACATRCRTQAGCSVDRWLVAED
jgi:hypothetical protein